MSPEIPRDASGRVIRPRPSQLLADVMDALGPDHLTTRTLMAALIERDRGAGVEPRAVTPVYGWHIPVLSDAPNVPYDMQENSLDIEATVDDLLPLAGGTMTGPLTLPGNAAAALHAVPKQQLDAALAAIGLAGFRVKVGNVVATTNVNGVITVPFGVTFSAPPVVVFSGGDASGMVPSQNLALMQPNLTATQFMAAEFIKVAGSSVRIHYIAIGPAPAAALDREMDPLVTYEYMADDDEPYPAPSDQVAP